MAADRTISVALQADVEGFRRAMAAAADATTQVGRSGEKSSGVLSRAMGAAGRAVAGVVTAAAAGGTAVAAAMVATGTAYNSLEQRSRAALTTLLGTEDAADSLMQKVAQFASTSPFPRQAFIEGTQQLLAFGMEAEKIIPTMGAVADAVAAAGGTSQTLSEIIFVLAQIQAAGKITSVDLMQLGQRGINAAELMGLAIGKTGQQIKQDITDGALGAEDALDRLVAGMQIRFGGAAENVKKTWDGAIDRIKASFRDISSIVIEPFVSVRGGGHALDWANAFADVMRAAQDKIDPLVAALADRLDPALGSVTDRLSGVADAVRLVNVSSLVDGLDELSGYAGPIGAVAAALVTMGTNSLPVLSRLGLAGINPLVAGLATLVALDPRLRGVMSTLLDEMAPLIPVARDTAAVILDAADAILDALGPAATDLVKAMGPVITALGTGLGQAAGAAAQALVPLAEVVADVLGVVSDLPTPILGAVTAFAALNALRGPLTNGLTAISTVFTRIREEMALQAALAGPMTVSYQTAGEVAQTAGRQIGGISAVTAVAARGVSSLGGALKAAFITNPVGAAIAGISAALGLFVAAQADAAQEAQEFEDLVTGLVSTLDDYTGAITRATREMAVQELTASGVLDVAQKYGLELDRVADAALGDAEAIAELNAELAPHRDRLDEAREMVLKYRQEVGHGGGAVREMTDAEKEAMRVSGELTNDLALLEGELGLMADAATEAQRVWRQQAEAMGEIPAAAEAVATGFADARQALHEAAADFGAVEDAAFDADQAVKDFGDTMRGLGSPILDARQAMSEWEAALDAAAETARENGAATGFATEKARENESAIDRMATAYYNNVAAMAANGAAMPELVAYTQSARDAFIEHAMALGYDRDEAEELANELDITVAAMQAAYEQAGLGVPTIDFSGTEDGANDAAEAVEGYTGALSEVPESIRNPWIEARNAKPATSDVQRFTDTLHNVPGSVTARVNADTSAAQSAVDRFVYRNSGRVIAMSIVATRKTAVADGGSFVPPRALADGGGYDRFGNYVPREPMIARGGRMIQWAEPETHWETYISGKPSKRQRNIDLWWETGRMLGVVQRADGGIDGPRVSSAPPQIRVVTGAPDAVGGTKYEANIHTTEVDPDALVGSLMHSFRALEARGGRQ